MEKKNIYPLTIRRYVDSVTPISYPFNWTQFINIPFPVDEVIVKNIFIETVNITSPQETGIIITDLPLKYSNELCVWFHPVVGTPQSQYLNRKFKTSNNNINGNYSFQMLGSPLISNGSLISPVFKGYLMILIEFVEYEK